MLLLRLSDALIGFTILAWLALFLIGLPLAVK